MDGTASTPERQPEPLPLIVGVTGHRDLRDTDLPELRRIICDLFRELQERCPSSPVQLLTPLAEGADRVAAEAALACNVQVVVPLPMPVEIYKSDFETPESVAEFDRLLAGARESFVLPMAEGNGPESILSQEEARVRQYGLLGAYIVGNCHVLLALWDGVRSEKSNGTADVVGFKLNGIPEAFVSERMPLQTAERGVVRHIITPRISNPHPPGEPLTMHTLFPSRFGTDEEGERSFNEVLEDIDRFNRTASV